MFPSRQCVAFKSLSAVSGGLSGRKTSVSDPDPHKICLLDPAACNLFQEPKAKAFKKAIHNKNRHREKDIVQLAKYVGNRQYRV